MASLTFVVALAVLTVASSTKYQEKGKVNPPISCFTDERCSLKKETDCLLMHN